ncbi:hypothetical protein WKI71_00335 [Streptomyces sp. MS1.AVA.1]|uniref:Uncharacterized protein n=1 Tax=Streptomyces machairae TaxID=3134109 RepID=A0ABU8UF70_9ACTN
MVIQSAVTNLVWDAGFQLLGPVAAMPRPPVLWRRRFARTC